MVINSLAIAFILLIWNQTNAFPEYVRLLGFKQFFNVAEFFEKEQHNYLSFLKSLYPTSFFIKLITCPICFSFWLALPLEYQYGFAAWMATSFAACFFYFWIFGLIVRSHHA